MGKHDLGVESLQLQFPEGSENPLAIERTDSPCAEDVDGPRGNREACCRMSFRKAGGSLGRAL